MGYDHGHQEAANEGLGGAGAWLCSLTGRGPIKAQAIYKTIGVVIRDFVNIQLTRFEMKIPSLLTVSPDRLVRVTDPDEEVFALYTGLAGSSECATEFDAAKSEQAHRHPTQVGSLGFVDSGASRVAIRLEIRAPPPQPTDRPAGTVPNRRAARRAKACSSSQNGRDIQVELKQDIFATKYRSGDTGSIVWRASIHLAEFLWYELLFPSTPEAPLVGPSEQDGAKDERGFLDMKRLTGLGRILELGAGTGSLGILCAGMFPPESRASWTVSDQFDLLAIIARNFSHNQIGFSTSGPRGSDREESGVRFSVEEIDWVEVEKQWLKTQDIHQPRVQGNETKADRRARYDLILAVDCLYNESLILPLLRTIDHLASVESDGCCSRTGPTLVIVLSELRSSEVVESFVRHWLALGPTWSIFRLPSSLLHRPYPSLNIANPHYVLWCAWKNRPSDDPTWARTTSPFKCRDL
ncbi:hypothetical protein PGT21_033498 [Puccinia graminis f. sp. tritici]|uniref:Uncharacterized protein n=1 Tax=Puccinia graminis f. sp. tritici TaxID=56615 RepID=A0A5B0MGJ5_PUCGR|nr:hypothetical protein PGT21_033498 [Puccinia graminis f. sp. tritici]